jgi:hypothetical protein
MATMDKILHEEHKVPGVYYALTSEGLELPVIDVTHPAFALQVSAAEQQELVKKFMAQKLPLANWPALIRRLFFKFALRGSILAQGIGQARNGYLTGMNTYFLKLGPKMLGDAYSKPLDRKITATLPAFGTRLRVQDMARLLADTLAPALIAHPQKPLRFVDIAGGPAMDSLNALILLRKEQPNLLAGRGIEIDVLDLDEAGPAFGKAALVALSQDGGPLDGVQVGFRHIAYDWTRTADLEPVLHEAQAKGALVICSSEGGLFEYGSDTDVEANLKTLRASPCVLAVLGSVTRADAPMRRLRKMSTAKLMPRGLEVFGSLVAKAGWKIGRAIERPFSDQVVLT